MICVTVTKDESLLPIGGIGIDHSNAFLSTDFSDQALWYIDAVMKTNDIKLLLPKQGADSKHGSKRRFQISAKYGLRVRLAIQIAARKITQGPGLRMLTHCKSFENI